MGFGSIKFKVIAVVLISFLIGACAIVYFLNVSYQNNIKFAAEESIRNAKEMFTNLKSNDVRTLTTAMEVLLRDDQYQQAFAQGNREKLLQVCTPLFEKLKKDHGINEWNFYTPDKKVFLKLHKPKDFGSVNDSGTFKLAESTKKLATGTELGESAYSLMAVAPYYVNGKLIGYIELSEDIDHFLNIMKKQSKNDFALLFNKKYLTDWKLTMMTQEKKLATNSDFLPDVQLLAATGDISLINFQGYIDEVPEDGQVLDQVSSGGEMHVRGIFPMHDSAGNESAAVFVMHDITDAYKNMAGMRNKAIAFIVILMVVILLVIVFMFNQLIIKRLNRVIDITNRVVGGDFYTAIEPSANDEIGKFESLFEQFRQVFVSVIQDLEEKMKG